jgi:hypothetical protein
MDKDEIVATIANDMLNKFNISQIINVLRSHAIAQANQYYDNLSDQQKTEVTNQILESRKQAEEVAETEEVAQAST